MNRLWQQLAIATNWPVIAAAAILSALGAISIWVDSPVDGPKQLISLAVAIGVMAAVQTVHYLILGRWAWGLYIVSLALVTYTVVGRYVQVPGVHTIKGASCWITFPGFSFEPSELMKVAFVMVLARYLRFRSNYRTLSGLIPPFALTLVPVILILRQPDYGVALLFIPALLAMLFVAGAKASHLLAVIGMSILLVPVFWFSGQENVPILKHLPAFVDANRRSRVLAMFDSDPKTLRAAGYQQECAPWPPRARAASRARDWESSPLAGEFPKRATT